MLPELRQKISLFRILHRIDTDLSKQIQQARCLFCGGPLHKAPYERKPRGGPENIPDEYMIRQSLCCGREGCRRRSLPPSCLFMGRKVYWSCVILLAVTLRQNRPESVSARKIEELFDISRNTIKRWMAYFRDEFPASSQWQRLRGRIDSTVGNHNLPGALVNYFRRHFETTEVAMIECLRFLASGQSGG